MLVLAPTEKGIGTGLSHSAITPQAGKDFALRDGEFVTPNMEVMAATRQLELGWAERKATFKRAIVSAVRDGEDWDIRSEYEYDQVIQTEEVRVHDAVSLKVGKPNRL